ncbi:DUF1003 domain-containing protein [uncultured Thioclava sp.]|uniref:DUF1003 domain-containing protein n=1 Tax=uncultured Thioclava sp. TaxID=473858 RepID=UPI0025FF8BB9|nr:DUF1003 domain-containing protein [uncultured Thioclava sp.]
MKRHSNLLSRALLGRKYSELQPAEQRVIEQISLTRMTMPSGQGAGDATFGQRLADRVAQFGGSWTFILIFGAVLGVWVLLNGFLLMRPVRFDPYPFVFLNLILSMLAAIQAPIIMMSQNRQSEKDRIAAISDYQVNLKAEIEILELHQKIDRLTEMLSHPANPR